MSESLARRPGRFLLCVLIGILGGAVAIALFGKPVYRIGPVSMRMSIGLSHRGETRVVLPPLGSVAARTHSGPASIKMTVEDASLEDLRGIAVELPQKDVLVKRILGQLRRATVLFAFRLLILAFLGGAVAGLLVLRPIKLRTAVASGGIAFLAIVVVLGWTKATFNVNALRKAPTYEGALRGAPMIAKLIAAGLINVGEMDSGVQSAAATMSRLYKQIESLDHVQSTEGLSRILVISDVHNNTIAIGFAAALAKSFDVDLVLDAGDLTDLGTHFETELAEQVKRIPREHIFVPGNHDSSKIIHALNQTRNTVVPNGRLVNVRGYRVYGMNDPASVHRGGRELRPTGGELAAARRQIARVLSQDHPDILLVHNDQIAAPFVGKAPIVVWGHSHAITIRKNGHSVGVNPGSTGASGVRYFQSSMPKAMSAVILYVRKTPQVRVLAADVIELTSPTGEFTISRRRF